MGPAPARGCTGRPSAPTASGWGWCRGNSHRAEVVGADGVPDDQHDVAGARGRRAAKRPRRGIHGRPPDPTRWPREHPVCPGAPATTYRQPSRANPPPVHHLADQPPQPDGQDQARKAGQRSPQQGRPDRERREQPGAGPQRDPASRANVHRCHQNRDSREQSSMPGWHGPEKISGGAQVAVAVPEPLGQEHDPDIEIARAQAQRDCKQDRGCRPKRGPILDAQPANCADFESIEISPCSWLLTQGDVAIDEGDNTSLCVVVATFAARIHV